MIICVFSCDISVLISSFDLHLVQIPNKCPRIEREGENDKMISKSLSQSTKRNTLNESDIVSDNHYKFDDVDVELYGESILSPPSIYREIINYSFKVSFFLIPFSISVRL